MKLPPRLVDGYSAFVEHRLPLERSRYHKLAEAGQQPEVMVICCCDSRVSPEVIFDAHPGELFVVRNVANLVPPYSPTGFTHGVSAALEFAVQNLKVGYIIVMGHSHCGGIRAYVKHKDRPDPGDFIDNWMSLIAPAAKSLGETVSLPRPDFLCRLEQASVVATLDNLTSFPWIRSRVEARELHLLGAYFDVGTGALHFYDPIQGAFTPIGADPPAQASAAAE
ncbi:MAG: carbonic anhydrase [Xanthobacteraceae bacterium]|jgi:carbonic anhydrase